MKRTFAWFLRFFGTRQGAMALAHYAGQAITSEHWRAATDFAELAIAADTTMADGHRMLGWARRSAGDAELARAAYHEGLRWAPHDFWLACDLGSLELAEERYEAAEAAYQRAVDLQPENADALYRLAQSVGLQGRYEEAERLLEQAREVAPDNADVLAMLGLGRYWRGDLQECVSLLTEAIARECAHPSAYYYLALALADLGRYEEALAALSGAMVLDPGDERFRVLREHLNGLVDPFGQGGEE